VLCATAAEVAVQPWAGAWHPNAPLPALDVVTVTVWASGVAGLALVDGWQKTVPSTTLRALAGATAFLLVAAAVGTGHWRPAVDGALCAFLAVTAFSVWVLVAPRSLGLGDVRMAGLVGLGAGAVAPLACLTLMACAPAVAALWERRRRRPVPAGARVALGPFLAVGGIAAVVGHGHH
jgi:leader peptidase (prepilin peptidase)/N-methyltransferase